MSSAGKIALVTGAGSGIGKAAALALLAEGYRVVLCGRRVERLEQTRAEAGENARNALVVAGDVTNVDSVRTLFAQTRATFSRLDVLFNNAGVNAPNALLEDLTLEQWQNVLATNLTGPFLCTQEAIKLMKSQEPRGGRIINNGSIAAHVPRPNSAPYAATKHGITGLTKATSLDCRKYDIACGQIDIGNALTEFANSLKAAGAVTEPFIDVQDVARAVLYMASLPLHANVQFMTVMATKMPYIGRG